MQVNALAPWYGSNRLLAHAVGEELRGCNWVGIPFAGGMSELVHVDARTVLVNDKHFHVINLAMTAADTRLGPQLYRRLRRKLFHPDELKAAQHACQEWPLDEMPDIDLAEAYFVSQWMGRSGKAGSDGEFSGGLSARWNANGGDSNTRYRSAVTSLVEWRRIFQRCNFSTLDVFEFLGKCLDAPDSGIYCDPPFPGPGDKYRHKFTEADHRRLAARLTEFRECRVVCRFYEHDLVAELYPTPAWQWRRMVGRKSTNDDAPEVLVIRNGRKS